MMVFLQSEKIVTIQVLISKNQVVMEDKSSIVKKPRFMKHYALEIYTVVAMLFITMVAMFMDHLTVIQQFAVWISFLCILHEWEEGRYPGGFLDLISGKLLQMDIERETLLSSRLITSVFIFTITLVPFFFGDVYPIFAIAMASFCIFEGIIHIAGIKLLKLDKPYSPGMVTAEVELVSGIGLITYIVVNHLGSWYDYTFGPFVFIACFALMQRGLMAMIGLHYKDMFAIMKRRFAKQ